MRERTGSRRGESSRHQRASGGPGPDVREVTEDDVEADLPAEVLRGLERAGYYPQVVADSLRTALAGQRVRAHLIHPETTFDGQEVRRHVTVLVLTATRLVAAHADDHGPDETVPEVYAVCSTESVPLGRVSSVVVSQVVSRPAQHVDGATPAEVSLTIGWGGMQRLDLEPAGCSDAECEADHGYTGTLARDDLTIRVAGAAEGADAVAAALGFARSLSAATAR
ncbi:DUF5998 family protein [Kineococcus gynurae]|uniref:DUF5998 family protein n=1 Tax=Kineococcus gynurae TaxID=452979 RepID=A0ABV5LV30_9ACTN